MCFKSISRVPSTGLTKEYTHIHITRKCVCLLLPSVCEGRGVTCGVSKRNRNPCRRGHSKIRENLTENAWKKNSLKTLFKASCMKIIILNSCITGESAVREQCVVNLYSKATDLVTYVHIYTLQHYCRKVKAHIYRRHGSIWVTEAYFNSLRVHLSASPFLLRLSPRLCIFYLRICSHVVFSVDTVFVILNSLLYFIAISIDGI